MTAEFNDWHARLEALIEEGDMEGHVTTGFLLVRALVQGEKFGSGESVLAYNYPLSQPIYVTRGLIELARTNYDERSRRALGDDE